MLDRRWIASVVRFGATMRAMKTLDAHAWLDAAGVEFTGSSVGPEAAEIACFV